MLFRSDAVKAINSAIAGAISLTESDAKELSRLMHLFVEDILGLKSENISSGNSAIIDQLMNMILDIRQTAKNNKDWTTSDLLRDRLNEIGVEIKDGKDGVSWNLK